jgi:Fe2+ or Zn2+ uptake regulation protein
MPKQLEEQSQQSGELSRSRALGTELLYAALSILQESGGEMSVKQLVHKMTDEDKNILPLTTVYFLSPKN